MADVRLDGVTKAFGDETAIGDIDLTVRDGEILGVVGPSGCGKTTMLRTIAGFETPTAGHVQFDAEEVTHVPPEQRNVGLVFQSYALFDNMSVLANVAFGLKMRGVDTQTRRDRATELLELLDIGELADRRPDTLSGGQQQRVGLARALAIEPDILLLDEPMTGLDAQLKERLRVELGSLLADLDVTALYVTHDQEEAMAMCDRIAVLNDGTVEQIARPVEIYERPVNQFVADFVGNANVLPATPAADTLDLGFTTVDWDRPVPSSELTAIVRPADITVDADEFEGTIQDRFYAGDRIHARIEVDTGEFLTVAVEPNEAAEPGETLSFGIDPKKVHLIDNGVSQYN